MLDHRLNAFREDLADSRLEGSVTALRFATGRASQIAVPVADMRRTPSAASGIDTQLLMGDAVTVFDEGGNFAWVQSARDSYVGYVEANAVRPAGAAPTHLVAAPRTFVYPEPNMKLPPVSALSMGSALAVSEFAEVRDTRYGLLAGGGAVIAAHLRAVDDLESDYVAIAETLIRTPYLWGGSSAFGIDCSGLVQLSMRMTGRDVLRDSDMQAGHLGDPLDLATDQLRRGDLVFWTGHVAIMTGEHTVIHANGNTMDVALEPLGAAIERIAKLYGEPTGYRRP
jgi:cell wall-associated NlpC family hydrolase